MSGGGGGTADSKVCIADKKDLIYISFYEMCSTTSTTQLITSFL